MQNIIGLLPEIYAALGETFYMLIFTIGIAFIVGVPLGTVLYVTRPGSLGEKAKIYIVLDTIVNVVRSFPFLILIVAIIPFTRWLVGTSLGTTAVIVPLSISAIPDFARLTEQALLEVNVGIVEMGESVGANIFQIVWKILYKEARAGIANATTIITISFFSYSTAAGLVGGGGIGYFAIRYGYYKYQTDVMIFTVIIIIIIVQIIQTIGRILVRQLDKRN